MNYNDPRYNLVKEATRQFMERHFECIPSILFEKLVEQGMEYDEVLELIDTKYRICPECDDTSLEQGKELDDTEHGWECSYCKAHYDYDACQEGEDLAYDNTWEHLALSGPDYGWPGSHGTVFWTTWNAVANKAAQCGFEVYESPMFGGYILAIDGGGYDFTDAHWMPLYLAMEITWHENEEGWDEALAEAKAKNLV